MLDQNLRAAFKALTSDSNEIDDLILVHCVSATEMEYIQKEASLILAIEKLGANSVLRNDDATLDDLLVAAEFYNRFRGYLNYQFQQMTFSLSNCKQYQRNYPQSSIATTDYRSKLEERLEIVSRGLSTISKQIAELYQFLPDLQLTLVDVKTVDIFVNNVEAQSNKLLNSNAGETSNLKKFIKELHYKKESLQQEKNRLLQKIARYNVLYPPYDQKTTLSRAEKFAEKFRRVMENWLKDFDLGLDTVMKNLYSLEKILETRNNQRSKLRQQMWPPTPPKSEPDDEYKQTFKRGFLNGKNF